MEENKEIIQLEGGTYEIIRNRLLSQGEELQNRLTKLNQSRKEIFGSIEAKLLSNERITTDNSCIPVDMVSLGETFIFGYNVRLGLKAATDTSDVLSVYSYENQKFTQLSNDVFNNKVFITDFNNLYKYYKQTQFVKFAIIGIHLYMVFRIGKTVNDIKTFKWQIENETIKYIDNRSDHEFVFPNQHEFKWTRTRREHQVQGKYPHVSIEDIVFVETTEGDLTIKVENNTETGEGVYAEAVDNPDQTLDDSEINYAIIGNIIVLKIKPYQEREYRYIVYNSKIKEAVRINSLEDSCVLLPDNHGIIFSNGYYLQTGESKFFDNEGRNMLFERRLASPNGEDSLFTFYNKTSGTYTLLSYNLIAQQISTPVICNGYTIFENGEMCYFKSNDSPQRHHAIQVWQTPYIHYDFEIETDTESFLYKVGNKDIVRAMSECNEILVLLRKQDSYSNLYLDIVKKATEILDGYYWINDENAFKFDEPIQEIRKSATAAIDEYEKVSRIKISTAKTSKSVFSKTEKFIKDLKFKQFSDVNDFVENIALVRSLSGEVISLRELRYVDLTTVEKLENNLRDQAEVLSSKCVTFLLKDDSLIPYEEKVEEIKTEISTVSKVVDANKIEENINSVAGELDLLIEIVSNLKIDDATQTTRIIDNISTIYSSFNQVRAGLRRKRKELAGVEGRAEFNAQIKLIGQTVINYLDLCDTPEKTDEFLSKLMVQLEELEGRFSEFDDFIEQISVKRDEIYNAFESRKLSLVETRNRRANTLLQSAERIISAISSRISRFEEIAEINGYFASDLMIEKLRNVVEQLLEIGDSVKADDVQSQLKTVREDAIRQLKDKNELYVGGKNVIKFGKYHFSVNTQKLELTMVLRGQEMTYHLTGTGFFEPVENTELEKTRHIWKQELISENNQIYRSEYLAYKFFGHLEKNGTKEFSLTNYVDSTLKEELQKFVSQRYNEGYIKGVHDHDAILILKTMLSIYNTADLLKFPSRTRACAEFFWKHFIDKDTQLALNKEIKSLGAISKSFPDVKVYKRIQEKLEKEISAFVSKTKVFAEHDISNAAQYIYSEISRGDKFVIDSEATSLIDKFKGYLRVNKLKDAYNQSVALPDTKHFERLQMIYNWLSAYCEAIADTGKTEYLLEAAVTIFDDSRVSKNQINSHLKSEISDIQGIHQLVVEQRYSFDYNHFFEKIHTFEETSVPAFNAYVNLKKTLIENFTSDLRLEEFRPRVMSSFVRNQLIDNVYLPLIGSNLAKQIGTAGENKRTDLMGLLLLISPPGYGKTTLMEYIANRLGIIFMKINGPAIGHEVTAVDPQEAPNAGAREELQKLNLAFEMGDNVMIYLDDIQHCNPEFLQKFISLSDGQRKIEGIYKGRSRTYDFRGKKVCIVMAGNPYTESGEKFQIPDMLANRADVYNLGDVIGETADDFMMSYIENCLTSNSTMARLASKNVNDVYTIMKLAETGEKQGLEFEGKHTPEEIGEYVSVVKKLIRVRDIVSSVNVEYIKSAGQQDEYRTEPPFKLQGSYRDMNKIAEKIMPIMNDKELTSLMLTHYESESHTLTTGAEANILKFKQITHQASQKDEKRWQEILGIFRKQQRLKGFGSSNQIAQVLMQMESIGVGISGIRDALNKHKN